MVTSATLYLIGIIRNEGKHFGCMSSGNLMSDNLRIIQSEIQIKKISKDVYNISPAKLEGLM